MDPISAFGSQPTASPGPSAVRPGGQSPEADPTQKAAQGFETIFLRQILKDLRKTAEVGGESSYMTGFYTDMFDDFLAEHLTKAGGIGLADAIKTYLERSGR